MGRKTTLALSLFVYCVGVFIGTITPLSWDEIGIKEPSSLEFAPILKNNFNSVMLMLSGAIFFGSTTALNLIFNGTFLAMVARASFLSGVSLEDLLLFVGPHSILEIPAIIIAGAAGFKIPYEVVRYLLGKKESVLTKEDIKEYLTLAIISIILIVIAAWIEANVTLKIAKAILKAKGI